MMQYISIHWILNIPDVKNGKVEQAGRLFDWLLQHEIWNKSISYAHSTG